MELLKSIIEDIFGKEYNIKVASDGFDLISKPNKDFAFVIGFVSRPNAKMIREKFVAMKRFDEVESLIVPILKKHKIHYRSYGNYNSTIQQIFAFDTIPGLSDLFYEFIEERWILPLNASSLEQPKTYQIKDNDVEDMIRSIIVEVKKAIDCAKIHFVDKYQTINDVFVESNKMNPDEKGEFFSIPSAIRKVLIEFIVDKSENRLAQISSLSNEFRHYKDDQELQKYAEATEALYEKLKSLGKR